MNAVYIEITNCCNLNCSFCPCGKTGADHVFMDKDLFQRSLEQASNIADNIYLHVLGEPTLHPDFSFYLKKLDEFPVKLTLTTNGTTISHSGNTILETSNLKQVNFSTHAYAELPQEKAKKNLENVLEFCKISIARRPEVYLNLRLWNVGDEHSNLWNQYMLSQIKKNFGTDSAENINLEHFCSRHKSYKIDGRLYLHQDSRFQWPENKSSNSEGPVSGTCRALDTHVAILHDGRVVACCLDHSGQITLGKIQEQSLKDILNSPIASTIREGFEKHQLRHPFCKTCSFCKRFK